MIFSRLWWVFVDWMSFFCVSWLIESLGNLMELSENHHQQKKQILIVCHEIWMAGEV